MKKVLTLLLLFIVACGPSEQEIQAQIDETVGEVLEEITTTTTTVPPTTTTSTTTTTTTTTTIPYAKETGVGFDDDGLPIPPILTSFERLVSEVTSENIINGEPIFKFTYENGTYENNFVTVLFSRDDNPYCQTKYEQNTNNEYYVTCNFEENLSDVPEGNLRIQFIVLLNVDGRGCDLFIYRTSYDIQCQIYDNGEFNNYSSGESVWLAEYLELQTKLNFDKLTLDLKK